MSTITPQSAANASTSVPAWPCGIPPSQLEAIVKAAAELFGTPVVPQLEEDPEIDESYYVLHMTVSHTVDEVADLRMRWFEILQQLAPHHCHFVRLSVSYS